MEFNRDKSLLFPPFAGQLFVFEARLKRVGLFFHVFNGLRTIEEQDELYARGRTKPGAPCRHKGEPTGRPVGTCPDHPLGAHVTKARGGMSWHNYALAADYVLDSDPVKPGPQWSWDIKADLNADGARDYRQMAESAREVGLESGYFWETFPDAPHVQNRYGLTLAEARELYDEGGIERVWEVCAIGRS